MNAPLDPSLSELAQQAGSTPAQSVPAKTLMQDGRVVKNSHKIEAINTHVESRVKVHLYSWQVSRELRRDFNLLSSKIVMRARSENAKRQIMDMIMEMRLQAELLKADAERMPIMQLEAPKELDLRLVSPLAAKLFVVFKEADINIARLTEASKAGVIMQSNQEGIVEPFFLAYRDLKAYLLGTAISNTKTAAQLGREFGIT